MPDVSLVLALHREGHYVARTLRSLAEAAEYARAHDISTELVAVLDRADAVTEAALRRFDPAAFERLHIMHADNGSLGPTRNDGCRAAHGTYILTADGDDLISFNTIERMVREAQQLGPRAILIPEFIFAFGATYHIAEYFGLDQVTPLALLADNPFVSRVFFHRSLLDALVYYDVSLTRGYAYEDWHFNCNAVASGYTFQATPETILFYRQRTGSLLQQSKRVSVGQIPPSPLFLPQCFPRICGPAAGRISRGDDPRAEAAPKGKKVLRDPVYLELMMGAHEIDPAVTPERFDAGVYFNCLGADLTAALAYHRLCSIIGDRQFDEVFLLPFLTTGGADSYVLNVMDAMVAHDPGRRFLVLFGERFARYAWLDRLPANCMHIDLFAVCPECDAAQHDLLCLKLLQSCAGSARIHLRSSEFGQRFFNRFAPVLSAYRPVFYRFSDGRNSYGDITLVEPSGFHFVAENIEALDRIVCDNATILAADQRRLRFQPDKWAVLYARMELPEILQTGPARSSSAPSLLWVSRLDAEKRLGLLLEIARLLAARMPDAVIDVYGRPTLDAFDVGQFAAYGNIRYHGAYGHLDDLHAAEHHCLLYTSSFDGMPIVLLEMVGAGLPVIAPDVGGIGELIHDRETGLLIACTGDDRMDAERYLSAIGTLVADATLRERIRRQAFALLRQRHAPAVFAAGVGALFGLQPAMPAPAEVR